MPVTGNHIALVCNPSPENQKAEFTAHVISRILNQKRIAFKIYSTPWPQLWDDISQVWIIGGDGTLNWFINQYPDIHLPLSILPGGSANDFRWMLYGNISPEQQVDQILNSTIVKVDAGSCNGRLFLNGVGIGFDGNIVKDLLGKRKLGGKASYLLSILKNIAGYVERPFKIEMQGSNLEQDCFMISVANGKRYGGGYLVAPKSSAQDQLLDINLVGNISPLQRIRYMPYIEKGVHLDLPFVKYYQAGWVRIETPQKVHAHIDGEYLYESFFDIRVLPGKFSFLL